MSDLNQCFTLRVKHHDGMIVIRAYDDLGWDNAGRIKLTCEVRQNGQVIFERGKLYCALHASSDGIKAKELVMSLVAMRPGDTDADYFADYTPDQIDWASQYGEELSYERECRYCDPETGSVRDGAE